MNLDPKKRDSKPASKPKAAFKQQSLGFTLSKKQKMYCAQAKWYTYSKQLVTKRTFEDPYFIRMVKTLNPNADVLTIYLLKKYLHAEFAVFVELLKICIDMKIKQSPGAAFGQLIHDGVMLANKSKYQSLGIQFIDPKWLANLVICFGFEQCSDGMARSIKKLIKNVGKDRYYTLTMQDIAGAMVSDCAAINVSKEFGLHLHEGCDMHDGDKVGQSATGALTRSTDKVEVNNPFPEGVELMKKASNTAKHFSYGTRTGKLKDIARRLGDAAVIKPQNDVNGTHVAAQRGLLYSLIHLAKAIKVYQLETFKEDQCLTSLDWKQFHEFEAILSITLILTTMAQYERLYRAAYGAIIKQLTYDRLVSPTIMVAKADVNTKSPRLVQEPIEVGSMTAAGSTCLERAIIETEQRFLGSTSEERLPVPGIVEIHDRQ